MQNQKPKPVFTEEKIQQRVKEIGRQISKDYEQKSIHVVGILEDAFIFMADLVRAISCPVICRFLKTEIRDVSEGNRSIREVAVPADYVAFEVGKDFLVGYGLGYKEQHRNLPYLGTL